MKKLYYLLLLVSVIVLCLNSCKQKNTQNEEQNSEEQVQQDTQSSDLGASLMITNCYACHNSKAGGEKRIAPPMAGVKKHYLDEFSSKEDFVSAIVSFAANPSEESSILPPMAIKRFGLMPNMSFPKDKLKIIADYLYDNQIETPQWTQEHEKKESTNAKPYKEGDFSEMGLHFALTTKGQLGKNLMGTIKREGTQKALEFCNTSAYPLTDSMAVVHNAKIKRVSDKARNPNNAANEQELKYIEIFKSTLAKGEEFKPILEEYDNIVSFYYPILSNKMCMQCHGDKKNDIKAEVLTSIQKLYPQDKATGYSPNQIRGIWSIEMKKIK